MERNPHLKWDKNNFFSFLFTLRKFFPTKFEELVQMKHFKASLPCCGSSRNKKTQQWRETRTLKLTEPYDRLLFVLVVWLYLFFFSQHKDVSDRTTSFEPTQRPPHIYMCVQTEPALLKLTTPRSALWLLLTVCHCYCYFTSNIFRVNNNFCIFMNQDYLFSVPLNTFITLSLLINSC